MHAKTRSTRRDGAQGVCFRWRVQPCPTRPIFVRTAIIRYAPLAVGLKPPARHGEARLRGRERNNDSKTITSVRAMVAVSMIESTAKREFHRRDAAFAEEDSLAHACCAVHPSMVRFQGSLRPRRLCGAFLQRSHDLMSDAKSIQIGRRNAPRAFPPQQHNVGQPGSPSYCRRTASALRRPVIPIYVSAPPIAITMIKGIRTSHHESITADCGMCGS